MTNFDYQAPAELFSPRGRAFKRQPLTYQRFESAALAVRYAIEEMEPERLGGSYLEVGEERFDHSGIRELYESANYPLPRRPAATATSDKVKPA